MMLALEQVDRLRGICLVTQNLRAERVLKDVLVATFKMMDTLDYGPAGSLENPVSPEQPEGIQGDVIEARYTIESEETSEPGLP